MSRHVLHDEYANQQPAPPGSKGKAPVGAGHDGSPIRDG